MEIYEITGFKLGMDREGVSFLDPASAFEEIRNGYVYRQELKSRKGFSQFANRLGMGKTDIADGSRVMGIFENTLPDSSLELIVITKEFLYVYNKTTNLFEQKKCAGALGAAHQFGITSNDEYVTGTIYLFKDGSQRFVFTSTGMSHVYFYNGTNVLNYTDAADNPGYQAPTTGTGVLINAKTVIYFNSRLNFFSPLIGTVRYNQGVLFSAIRNNAGNGEKYDIAGSGFREASTYEIMNGSKILGDIVIMNFNRSNWSMSRTGDKDNPYFIKKIPSVLGTDASYSAVSYGDTVKSIGRTGAITTDGRQSVRFDNKIPYLTKNEIDAEFFSLTYGGFDREENQFMFSYKDASIVSAIETQDKVLCYNYEENTWSIYDQRFSVFGQTQDGKNLTWDDIDENYDPSWKTWANTDDIWEDIGIGENVQKTLAGDDNGFVYQLNNGYDDYFSDIGGITQAANCVIAIDPCPFEVGDKVYIRSVEGMTEINGQIGNILATTAASITTDIDTSAYEAYTPNSGYISRVIDFIAKLTPFNPYRDKGRKCYVSCVEFLIDIETIGVYVDISEDDCDDVIKTVELVPDTTIDKKRQWVSAVVNQECDFLNIKLRKLNIIEPVVITSIRVHCKPGLLNNI